MKEMEVVADISANMGDRLKAALELVFKGCGLSFQYTLTVYVIEGDRCVNATLRTLLEPKFVAQFKLSQAPMCEAICWSHNMYVENEFRKKGIGTELNNLKVKAACLVGFTRLMATVDEANKEEISLLLNNDWKVLGSFPGIEHHGHFDLWERIL